MLKNQKNKLMFIVCILISILFVRLSFLNYNFIKIENIIIFILIIKIIKQQNYEKRMQNIIFYDTNSGLPNRNYLNRNMPHRISNLLQEDKFAAVIFLDIDNFKAINDTVGYNVGDEFLKIIGQGFKDHLKEKDEVFHLGGDEFLFLITSITNKQEAGIFIETLLSIFREPVLINNIEIKYMTASIGAAMLKSDGKDLDTLLNHSNDAMYFAKNDGKNKYKFYSKVMDSKIFDKIKFQNDLTEAIQNDEFEAYYQPKVDGKTGELVGMEALIRWIKSDGVMVPPDKFIPFAEESKLIIPIGEKMLRKVCMQNKIWQDMGLKKVSVSVNLSACQLQDDELFAKIKDIFLETGLSSEYIEVEITESMVMENLRDSIEILNKLRNMGVKISLDDFGTGYSSLNYLRILPIDKVKIDKSFIDSIVVDDKRKIITNSIIELLHNMKLNVVAEGVEEKEQLKLLNEYSCDEIQGYFFSKPLNKNSFECILKKGYFDMDEI